MKALTAVRYVNSAIFAGVKDERIYEKRQKKKTADTTFLS